MAHLDLRLLGAPEARLDGKLITFPTRRSFALLIFLAVEGGFHTRDKLAGLFWPESDNEHAQMSLRRDLANLRRVTGGDVILHQEQDQLGLAESYDLDLHLVESIWKEAQKTRETSFAGEAPVPSDLLVKLHSAADQYRGEFLDGFDMVGSPEFDTWVSTERELWQRRVGLIFDRLTDRLEQAGEHHEAAEAASRWIVLDPLNEAAHLRLMQISLAAGDRAGALRAYAACKTVLENELAAEPSPEIETLAARLRDGPLRVDAPGGKTRVSPLPKGFILPLVGRSAEHQRMAAAYFAAQHGLQPRALVLEGEPGIGKSRLGGEFLQWAAARGAIVLRGQAFESGEKLPYGLVVESLRSCLANSEFDLHGSISEAWLAELARLLPELRERYPDLPAPVAVSDAEMRTRLFEAAARFGQALAGQSPLVIFLDDFHWADSDSLDLIRYVARRWKESESAVLLLLTLRSENLKRRAGETSSLLTWLNQLGRDIAVEKIALGHLSSGDVAQIVAGLFADQPVDPARLAAFNLGLFRETAGQPLFIVETLKSLFELEAGTLEGTGRWLDQLNSALEAYANSDRRANVPASVREVILERLARLSQSAFLALTAGAVLGYRFSFEMALRIAGLREEDGLLALDELLLRGLLEETGDQLHFTHDRVREVVYAEMGETRRRVFHRHSLEALEAANRAPTELALHAQRSGQLLRAGQLYLLAGNQAMRLFALYEAIDLYQRALGLLKEVALPANRDSAALSSVAAPSAVDSRAIDFEMLYLQLGRAYELVDDFERANATYDQMIEYARGAANQELRCKALNRQAIVASQHFDLVRAKDLLEEAQRLATELGNPLTLAETEWNLAQVNMYAFDPEKMQLHGQKSVALARQAGHQELIARGLNVLAYSHLFLGDNQQVLQTAEEARVIYVHLGDRPMQADCLGLIADAYLRQGKISASLQAAQQGVVLCKNVQNRWGQAHLIERVVLALGDQGEYQQALESAQEGITLAQTVDFKPLHVLLTAALGRIYRLLENVGTAMVLHNQALSLAKEHSLPDAFLSVIAAELCADEWAQGNATQAGEWAFQALDFRSFGLPPAGFDQDLVTRGLLYSGKQEEAIKNLEYFSRYARAGERYQVPYLRGQAAVAQYLGDAARAKRLLQDALNLASRIGLPGESRQLAGEIDGLAGRAD